MPEPNPESGALGIGLGLGFGIGFGIGFGLGLGFGIGLGFGPEHEREYGRWWRSPPIVLPPLPASARCPRPALGEGRAQRTEAGRQR